MIDAQRLVDRRQRQVDSAEKFLAAMRDGVIRAEHDLEDRKGALANASALLAVAKKAMTA